MTCIFDSPTHANGGCIFDSEIIVAAQEVLGSTGLFDPKAHKKEQERLRRLEEAAEKARQERLESKQLLRQELIDSIEGKPEVVQEAVESTVSVAESSCGTLSAEQINSIAEALRPVQIKSDSLFERIDRLVKEHTELKRQEQLAIDALYEEESLFLLMA